MKLTSADLRNITLDYSSASRSELAEKFSMTYSADGFNEKEASVAIDIFRLLLNDTEKSVREKLAENLYDNPNVPHDIIFKLACDEADISSKILQFSLVLTDDDLLAIVNSTKEVIKLCAIAKREKVFERLSHGLLNTKQIQVLNDLLKNKGAEIGEQALLKAWPMVSGDNSLLKILVKRGGLPLTIIDKLYNSVSDDLKRHIASEYKFNSPILKKAILDTREWQMLGLIPVDGIVNPDDDEKVEDLVDHLYISGRLTHSLIIRALCMGALNLFETSLAKMAEVPRVNARILPMGGTNGFEAIYKAADMPEGFSNAVERLLNIALSLTEYGYYKPDDFRKRVIEEVYIKGYHRTVDGMGYLLSTIGGRVSSGNSAVAV